MLRFCILRCTIHLQEVYPMENGLGKFESFRKRKDVTLCHCHKETPIQ